MKFAILFMSISIISFLIIWGWYRKYINMPKSRWDTDDIDGFIEYIGRECTFKTLVTMFLTMLGTISLVVGVSILMCILP